MSETKIYGQSQIEGLSIDIGRLFADFLGGSDWDITDGNNDATITGLADPINPQDVATKFYVDSVAAGLDPKESCRLATFTALPANTPSGSGVGKTLTADTNGALTVDGQTPSIGDRILVKNESTTTNNGIYIVTAVGDGSNPWILTRATDFDGSPSNEVSGGAFTFVEDFGTNNKNTGWVVKADGTITVDTDPIIFVQFSGAGTFTAGDGIDITGSVISVDVTDIIDTNYGLTEDTNNIRINLDPAGALSFDGVNFGIQVNVDNSSIEISSNAIQVKADGINDTHIDWGSGANQVNASDVPLDTGGSYGGSALNVQDALEEIEASVGNEIYGEEKTVTNGNPTIPALNNIPVQSNTERVYWRGLRLKRSDDYTIVYSTGVITLSFSPLNPLGNQKLVVDYKY